MTALVLQARLDSKRLPNKALLPLGGKPMLLRVMEALSSKPWDHMVLACPTETMRAFTPLAEQAGFNILGGSKEDVLSRYCDVIRAFAPTRIVRATGDNPFVFMDAAWRIAEEGGRLDADYAAYQGLPLGAGVESVASRALLRAETEAVSQYDKEHVCPFLYGHPEAFVLHRPCAPSPWDRPRLRLTVDTEADYAFALRLYETLNKCELRTSPEDRYSGFSILAAAGELAERGESW
jgi:spore coat polysaccharide biosynthesis protein SpsF